MVNDKKSINASLLFKESKELQQRIEEHKQEVYRIKKGIEKWNQPKQPSLHFLRLKKS